MSATETPPIQPLSKIFEYSVTIRESHLDVFGHVNNAAYLVLFEEARWEILTASGYNLEKIMVTQQGPTVLDLHLQFQREVRNRARVVIKTCVVEIGRKTQTLRQVMVNEAGEDACIGTFICGLFDLKARKLIAPSEDWKKTIGIA